MKKKTEVKQDTLSLIDLDDTAAMEAVAAELARDMAEEEAAADGDYDDAADDTDAEEGFDVSGDRFETEVPAEDDLADEDAEVTGLNPEAEEDAEDGTDAEVRANTDAGAGSEEENAVNAPICEGEMFRGEVSVDTMLLMEYAEEIEKAVGVQADTRMLRAEERDAVEAAVSQDTLNVLDLSDTATLDALEVAAEEEAQHRPAGKETGAGTERNDAGNGSAGADEAYADADAESGDDNGEDLSGIEEEEFVDLNRDEDGEDREENSGKHKKDTPAGEKHQKQKKGKKGSSRRFPGKIAVLAAAAVLLLAVAAVLVVGLIAGNRRNAGNRAELAALGDRIGTVGMAGRNGLAALAEARSAMTQEPQEPEPEDPEPVEELLVDVSFTSVEQDIKIKFVEHGTEVLVRDVPFEVLLTDSSDRETSCTDTDTDGIIYQAGLAGGDYTVTLVPVEGYAFAPYDNPVNVRDKIVYERVSVAEEIRTESEINVAAEDTAANAAAAEAEPEPAAPTNNDTVEYVESTRTAVGDSDGYKRIDKSTIPTPSYARIDAGGREAVFLAGSYYAACEAASRENVLYGGAENVPAGAGPYTAEGSLLREITLCGSGDGMTQEIVLYGSAGCELPADVLQSFGNGVPAGPVLYAPDGDSASENSSDSDHTDENSDSSSGSDNSADSNNSDSSSDNGNGNNSSDSSSNNSSDNGNSNNNNNNNNNSSSENDSSKEPEDLEARISAGDDLTLTVGDTKTLSPKAEYDGSRLSGGKFSYESSDSSVVKVDSDGKLSAQKAGSATITVSYSNKENDEKHYHGSTTIIVTVKERTQERDPAKDNDTKLKDKDGNQVYIKNSSGEYKEAVFSDYYTATEFYIATEVEYSYTGWQTINGNTYYYDKNGNKVTGDQIIRGVSYSFSSDGVLKVEQGAVAGIDVSKWNGSIDWTAVKNAGVSFVIIRCGYRGSSTGVLVEDSLFKSNIQGARAAGLKVGVYFFTQAVNEVEAVEEASMCLQLVQGYGLSYPIFIDTEYTSGRNGRADRLDRATRTAVCNAFCATIQNAGYSAGVYASKSWYNDNLNYGALSGYRIWLAQYASQPTFTGRYDMWQYSEKGSVDGIRGNVDMNWSYLGY